jgi:hypothetical protein
MTTYRIWISAAVLAFLTHPFVNSARAQRAVVTPRVSSVHLHTAPAHLTTPTRASGKSTSAHSRGAVSSNNLFASNGFGSFGSFPGAGFNSGFFNQDWILAAIDPATQWRLFEAQRFSRNVGFAPGFYLLNGGAYYAPSEPAPAEGEPAPQEQSAPAETEPTEAMRNQQQPAQTGSEPLEDVGQFVLVLRSGRQVEAVAFTRTDDHIVYVTSDGFRRTLALADLDPDATIRVNEERGTPLAIPL